MTGFLASLSFLVAVVVALGALGGTVLRYRESVAADLVAFRDLPETRDIHFRVFAFGGQPVLAASNKLRRNGQRVAARPAAKPAGWREAA